MGAYANMVTNASVESPMPPAVPAEFAPLARGLYLEGLAVDERRGWVWYSDVIAGGIHGVKPDGAVVSLNTERMWTGGIALNEDGAVLSSGAGGIMWNHPDSGESGWLLEHIDGAPINGINEMAPDGAGGIYFGTVDIERIQRGEPTRPASIYRLSVTGDVTLVGKDLGFVNGIMVSAEGKHLYYNDTFDSTYVFDVLPDRSLANRRRLLQKEDCDGMALDAAGNLWITGFRSRELTRIRPDGTVLEAVPTPGAAISQIRFGGPDRRDFYVTCVPADGGDNLAVGVQPTEKRSILYRGRSEVPGMPIAAARFRLG
jgi:sugar lactone lactonase YvrE